MVAKKQLQVEKLVIVELATEFAFGDGIAHGCSTNDEFLSRHYDDSDEVLFHCECCDSCGL